ncbi:MAG: glycoside hydrolase family 105 protein, partial [Mesorhizobium sp.]
VGLYGLVCLWRHNRDPKLLKTIEDWYERHLRAGLPPMNINTTAPMMALALLWGETRDPRWETALGQWAERLLRDMPRTPEGGFQHNVSDKINDDELWDDTLFMAGL